MPLALLLAAAASGAVAPLSAQPPIAPDTVVARLPVIEARARSPRARALVILLTGDGGWATIDRELSARLTAAGLEVVGLDARAYLSTPRTPARAAGDVAALARHYLAAWRLERLVIVGYSRGADIAPFIAARLPADLRARLDLVAMLGLATHASFEFHWVDLVRDTRRPTDLPTAPELARLRGTRMVCVYGVEETDSGCRDADPGLVERVSRAGGHHFGGDYDALAGVVLTRLPRPAAPPR